MDKKHTCPKCGKRAWKVTQKKNKLKCTSPYCYYVSGVMTQQEMAEVLNYVPIPPTPLELYMEEIREESQWIDAWGQAYGDYIELNKLEDILEKYISNK